MSAHSKDSIWEVTCEVEAYQRGEFLFLGTVGLLEASHWFARRDW